MRDLDELGFADYGRPREPVSESEFLAFERAHGVKLPEAYKQMLRYSNGGRLELSCFQPPGCGHWVISSFYHLGKDREDPYSLWQNTEWTGSQCGERAIPIAHDGGGNLVVLDMTHDPSTVRLCIHDEFLDEEMTRCRVLHVADSFEEFLDLLHSYLTDD